MEIMDDDSPLKKLAVAVQLITYNSALYNKLSCIAGDLVHNEMSNDSVLKGAAEIYSSVKEFAASVSAAEGTRTQSVRRAVFSKCHELGYLSTVSEATETASSWDTSRDNKPLKIYADGVFDLVHFGHLNALRQARELGDELYVGVTSDEEVFKAKGVYPIYTCEERAQIIRACKWVTGVIPGVPYDVTIDFFKTTGCDFVAHGDDIALNGDGVDSYEEVRRAGLLKTFKRTVGISTTTLASKLLGVMSTLPISSIVDVPTPVTEFVARDRTPSLPKFGQIKEEFSEIYSPRKQEADDDECHYSAAHRHPYDQLTKQNLLPSERLLQFIGKSKQMPQNARVVYTDGSFDLFHSGHVNLLRLAKEYGDFLIVGVYGETPTFDMLLTTDDCTIRESKGPPYPVQTLLERSLNLLAMRDVDEVIIGAPAVITSFLLKSFRVSAVVRGKIMDSGYPRYDDPAELEIIHEIFHEIESESSFTSRTIVDRIIANRTRLEVALRGRRVKEAGFELQSI